MLSDKAMEYRIEDIKNKLYPNEMDDAILYMFTQMTKLKHENEELQRTVKELYWRLEQHD